MLKMPNLGATDATIKDASQTLDILQWMVGVPSLFESAAKSMLDMVPATEVDDAAVQRFIDALTRELGPAVEIKKEQMDIARAKIQKEYKMMKHIGGNTPNPSAN